MGDAIAQHKGSLCVHDWWWGEGVTSLSEVLWCVRQVRGLDLCFVLFCFGMFLTCSNPHGFRASFGETVGGSTSAA